MTTTTITMKTDDDVGHDNDDHDNREEIRWKHHNGFHNEASTSQAIEFPIENLIFKILKLLCETTSPVWQ